MVNKIFNQKCDACNFDSKVKIENIKEQRFRFCHSL